MAQSDTTAFEFVRLSDIPQMVDACARLHAQVSGDDSLEGFEMRQAAFRRLALAGESIEDVALALQPNRVEGDSLAGFCVLVETEIKAFDDLGPWLTSLTLHPDHATDGLEAALAAEGEAIAKADGATELYLHSADKEAWLSRGYAEIEPFERIGQTIWVMGKLL